MTSPDPSSAVESLLRTVDNIERRHHPLLECEYLNELTDFLIEMIELFRHRISLPMEVDMAFERCRIAVSPHLSQKMAVEFTVNFVETRSKIRITAYRKALALSLKRRSALLSQGHAAVDADAEGGSGRPPNTPGGPVVSDTAGDIDALDKAIASYRDMISRLRRDVSYSRKAEKWPAVHEAFINTPVAERGGFIEDMLRRRTGQSLSLVDARDSLPPQSTPGPSQVGVRGLSLSQSTPGPSLVGAPDPSPSQSASDPSRVGVRDPSSPQSLTEHPQVGVRNVSLLQTSSRPPPANIVLLPEPLLHVSSPVTGNVATPLPPPPSEPAADVSLRPRHSKRKSLAKADNSEVASEGPAKKYRKVIGGGAEASNAKDDAILTFDGKCDQCVKNNKECHRIPSESLRCRVCSVRPYKCTYGGVNVFGEVKIGKRTVACYNGEGFSFALRLNDDERLDAEQRVSQVLTDWTPPRHVDAALLAEKLKSFKPSYAAKTPFRVIKHKYGTQPQREVQEPEQVMSALPGIFASHGNDTAILPWILPPPPGVNSPFSIELRRHPLNSTQPSRDSSDCPVLDADDIQRVALLRAQHNILLMSYASLGAMMTMLEEKETALTGLPYGHYHCEHIPAPYHTTVPTRAADRKQNRRKRG
ncbi:hypothetical protein C8Q78DRAFT_1005223 [Trametes maxima]|nr:hypothetical protein C8Q78DRAFT_1005223 [Trametes maxima]